MGEPEDEVGTTSKERHADPDEGMHIPFSCWQVGTLPKCPTGNRPDMGKEQQRIS